MAERFSFDPLLKQLSCEGEDRNDCSDRAEQFDQDSSKGMGPLWRDSEKIIRYMTAGENVKLYIARVRGDFGSQLTGTVDRPLRRESRESFRMIAADDGKEARTHYAVLARLPDGTSLVACRIEHGRTHQIRVHMSLTGHPIVGDRMYGPEAEDLNDQTGRNQEGRPERDPERNPERNPERKPGEGYERSVQPRLSPPLMLHAYRAGFRQPFTGEKIMIEAPLPEWAQAIPGGTL
jgi:23S rRNA pseudouridine1911/1915/1917 synthase